MGNAVASFFTGVLITELIIMIIKLMIIRKADVKTMKQLDDIQELQKIDKALTESLLTYYKGVSMRLDVLEQQIKDILEQQIKKEEDNNGDIS